MTTARTWLAVLSGLVTLTALFSLVVLGARRAAAWKVALAFAAAAIGFAAFCFDLLG
jgi:hypothetical protein